MKKKATTTATAPPPTTPASDVSVTQVRAVPAFTDTGVRILMAELAAARFARVVRQQVLSGRVDGESLSILLPNAGEFDLLKQFAAQVASTERGACLDVAETVIGKEQREPLAQAFVKRGPIGIQMRIEWTPDTKIWMAK